MIIEQTPDQRVAWRSTTGAQNASRVSFQPLGANQTRLTLRLDYEPEGVVENVGNALGLAERRVTGDLGLECNSEAKIAPLLHSKPKSSASGHTCPCKTHIDSARYLSRREK